MGETVCVVLPRPGVYIEDLGDAVSIYVPGSDTGEGSVVRIAKDELQDVVDFLKRFLPEVGAS